MSCSMIQKSEVAFPCTCYLHDVGLIEVEFAKLDSGDIQIVDVIEITDYSSFVGILFAITAGVLLDSMKNTKTSAWAIDIGLEHANSPSWFVQREDGVGNNISGSGTSFWVSLSVE